MDNVTLKIGKIIYSSFQQLFIYHTNDETTILLEGLPAAEAPSWDGAGRWVAFGIGTIAVVDTQGDTAKIISEEGLKVYYPTWHPTAALVVYAYQGNDNNNGLCFYDIDADKHTYYHLPFDSVIQPCWSPDGKFITFVGALKNVKHIYVLEVASLGADDLNIQQLTQNGRFNHAPAWHPTENIIAYETFDTQEKCWRIMFMTLEGEYLETFTPAGINEHHPAWGPNDYLAVERQNDDGPGSNIYVLSYDRSQEELISTNGGSHPAWFSTAHRNDG